MGWPEDPGERSHCACPTLADHPRLPPPPQIPRINLQRRKFPLQLPPPGLSNKRIRSRLRAIYPYSLGFINHLRVIVNNPETFLLSVAQ